MTEPGSPNVAGDNPFVGPHPLETGQEIFGRDTEIENLFDLLCAERIVLLHSPSGAGKSSLVQAGLIPRLRERFDVWGPVRVSLPLEEIASGANRYALSAMAGFEGQVPASHRRATRDIAGMNLAEYAATRPHRRSAPPYVALIFDQFEEILTTDPLGFDAKQEFFAQLGELLRNPKFWALFALREDYLAPLDPYVQHLPTHLKNRFRLDLLTRESARLAIAIPPTEERKRVFDPAAVDKLVADLATMQVQQPDGSFETQHGPYVEPLHLQVVCRQLWERMPADDLRVDPKDVEAFGDVTTALSDYYSSEVARVAGGDERVERMIREWFDTRLITPNGVRAQVLRGERSN